MTPPLLQRLPLDPGARLCQGRPMSDLISIDLEDGIAVLRLQRPQHALVVGGRTILLALLTGRLQLCPERL